MIYRDLLKCTGILFHAGDGNILIARNQTVFNCEQPYILFLFETDGELTDGASERSEGAIRPGDGATSVKTPSDRVIDGPPGVRGTLFCE